MIETMCGYKSGPGQWDEIEFNQDDIRIRISAHKRKDDFLIHETLLIPEGITAKISSDTAVITLAPSDTKINLRVHNEVWVGTERMDLLMPDAPLVGKTFHGSGRDRSLAYLLSFGTRVNIEGNFEVALPDIMVNGRVSRVPNIHFFHEKIVLLSPINC